MISLHNSALHALITILKTDVQLTEGAEQGHKAVCLTSCIHPMCRELQPPCVREEMEEPQLIPHRDGCLLSRGFSEIFCIYFFSANRKDLLPSKHKNILSHGEHRCLRNLPPVREMKTRSGDSGNLQ